MRLWPKWYQPIPMPTVAVIVGATANHFGLTRGELLSGCKKWSIAHPRQLAMYIAREHTKRSLTEIGRHLGGLDHTSVIHGIRAAEGRLSTDSDWRNHYMMIRDCVWGVA